LAAVALVDIAVYRAFQEVQVAAAERIQHVTLMVIVGALI
jgi:hypothetical protein